MLDQETNNRPKNNTAPPLKSDRLVLPSLGGLRDEVTSGQPTTINGSVDSTTAMGRFTISPLPIDNVGRVSDHSSINSNGTLIGYSPTNSNGVPIKYSPVPNLRSIDSSVGGTIEPSSITLSSNSNNADPYSPSVCTENSTTLTPSSY